MSHPEPAATGTCALPLLTEDVHTCLRKAADAGESELQCSLDLQRSQTLVAVAADHWSWNGKRYPYLAVCKERTIYFWDQSEFRPAARYAHSLIKLVPTQWGAPTFEIDGIKMLPTAQVSPFEDARRKVGLIQPRGKTILDTCGGLGYFAQWCLQGGARHVVSYEKNPDVLWLRTLNPWSPSSEADPRLELRLGDVYANIESLAGESFDAALHDPPRFGIAGELYSQRFYDELARVLKRRAKLFHYTGTPNKLTSGRDVPNEVARRLQRAGFTTRLEGDGVLAVKASASR
jgi:predicted methyltransferase